MKKLFLIMFFLLFAATAQAENVIWVKGGLSFLNGDTFCTNNEPFIPEVDFRAKQNRCSAGNNGNSFFIQMSPVSLRGKINDSKLGYRVEPWIGYSQINKDDFETIEIEYNGVDLHLNNISDIKIKNIQFGVNLFMDYEIMPKLSIYGGPMLGFEISKTTSKFIQRYFEDGIEIETQLDGRYVSSGFNSNFIYGAEVGAEYKIVKNVALSAFGGVIQHGLMVDQLSLSQYNLGTEVRLGAGVIYYW